MQKNRINSIFGKYGNLFNAERKGKQMARTPPPKEKSPSKAKQIKQTATAKKQQPSIKERITVQIGREVIEGVKDIVYWHRLTVAQFVEDALREAITKAENGNGGRFKKREAQLRAGRPLK